METVQYVVYDKMHGDFLAYMVSISFLADPPCMLIFMLTNLSAYPSPCLSVLLSKYTTTWLVSVCFSPQNLISYQS